MPMQCPERRVECGEMQRLQGAPCVDRMYAFASTQLEKAVRWGFECSMVKTAVCACTAGVFITKIGVGGAVGGAPAPPRHLPQSALDLHQRRTCPANRVYVVHHTAEQCRITVQYSCRNYSAVQCSAERSTVQ